MLGDGAFGEFAFGEGYTPISVDGDSVGRALALSTTDGTVTAGTGEGRSHALAESTTTDHVATSDSGSGLALASAHATGVPASTRRVSQLLPQTEVVLGAHRYISQVLPQVEVVLGQHRYISQLVVNVEAAFPYTARTQAPAVQCV